MTAPLIFILVLLFGFLGSSVWVGFSLMSIGALSLEVFKTIRVDRFMALDFWSTATAFELVTLPLFILMGEILFQTKLSENLFAGLAPWVRRLPGRLTHVNVLGSTIFAAVSGSSAATTATVGRITLPELTRMGYNKTFVSGALAGSGTIGFLIPPSIPLIVYGVLAEVSILKLFMAGIIPGLILALLFMLYIGIRATISPELAPAVGDSTTMLFKLKSLLKLLPTFLLVLFVVGSMYAGFASVTEAAAIGVLGAAILAAFDRRLNISVMAGALMGTIRTCSMIAIILAGALFLSKAMARLAIPTDVAAAIAGFELSPMALILLLMLFYLVLGCFLDGLSTIVMTLPVTLPLVIAAGFDPIWFGVFLIITIEMAQITPPIGFNLFVIKSITGQKIGEIALAALPFCVIMIALVLFLTFYPGIVTWLPRSMS
jgi:C4-dicarboxylate transporter, DctM subunit